MLALFGYVNELARTVGVYTVPATTLPTVTLELMFTSPMMPTPPATRNAPVVGSILGVPLTISKSLTVSAVTVTFATEALAMSTQ